MKIQKYLEFIQNEQYGIPPKIPTQNPRAPMDPQSRLQKNTPDKSMNQIKNQSFQNKQHPKLYFNYMSWTTKILKQGEIFRKNCYLDNCEQFEIGTGDRRICKDRCDIETCKRVIKLLQASISKCSQSNDPNKCKQRYMELIPLYKQKLNNISKKFLEAQRRKKQLQISVG